jgi:hypothetical protein
LKVEFQLLAGPAKRKMVEAAGLEPAFPHPALRRSAGNLIAPRQKDGLSRPFVLLRGSV